VHDQFASFARALVRNSLREKGLAGSSRFQWGRVNRTVFELSAAQLNRWLSRSPNLMNKVISFALLAGITCFAVSSINLFAKAEPVGTGPSFKGPLGLQLYSLRDQFAQDVPGTLDKVREFGFKYVELAGMYGLTPEQFKAELDARGLKAVSGHYPYERFRDDVEGIAREAKALGVEYVGCASIPHGDRFNEQTCREVIAVFNAAGEKLAKQGIKFFYHPHGDEFQPYEQGTLFDLLMTETKPEFVSYEMDVFWIVHGGQDPVTLLEKYGSRFQLTHLKGMKVSTPTGLLTGHSDPTNAVPMGTGKIDYPPILHAAEKAGVKWHFIEDESPSSEQQIPQSLRYLEQVKW
jgi:sugar phosphate isomerase/epimerase